MKILFVFGFCVATAMAGVLPWSQGVEDELLTLFKRYCSASASSGTDGEINWHCKSSNIGPRTKTTRHSHRLDLPGTNQKNLVFIETPADEYRHEIAVTGELNSNQNTKIVVVPSQDKHQYQVTSDVKTNSGGGKPSIFFLQTDPKGNGRSRHADLYADASSPVLNVQPAPETDDAGQHQHQVSSDIKVNTAGKPAIFFLEANPKETGESLKSEPYEHNSSLNLEPSPADDQDNN